MIRQFFLKTRRIGFSKWLSKDIELAKLLWGNPQVTRYICATGKFSTNDIIKRLKTEIQNESLYRVQYWPIFTITENSFIGCCGLRPRINDEFEIGFHLRPEFWGKGFAEEAAKATIHYAFTVVNASKLFAGHNPKNIASKHLLKKLGFSYIGDEFYVPTGLYHPSYEMLFNKPN